MKTYVIRDNDLMQVRRFLAFKEGAETIKFDFSPWADDNGSLTACVVSVKTGSATISNESLTSNVKTFVLTTPQAGASMIQLKGTAGNNTPIINLHIFAKDPNTQVYDYGITQT